MLTIVIPSVSTRAAEKAEAQADAEEGKKKKGGGVQVPEEWPWEEAKKVFEQPDVTPAAELQVGLRVIVGLRFHCFIFYFD
jgi:flap endonuclease-1